MARVKLNMKYCSQREENNSNLNNLYRVRDRETSGTIEYHDESSSGKADESKITDEPKMDQYDLRYIIVAPAVSLNKDVGSISGQYSYIQPVCSRYSTYVTKWYVVM